MNTPAQSVGDLAIALGMWMVMGANETQQKCFVESVLVLAHRAGVSRQEAIQPFDVHHRTATEIWDTLDQAELRDAECNS